MGFLALGTGTAQNFSEKDFYESPFENGRMAYGRASESALHWA